MILPALLAVVVVLSALLLFRMLRSRSAPVRDLADFISCSKPIDLQSFRNLVDPEEEAYLRASVPPADFRRLQRARMLAAAEYVRRASHNAALVLQIADAARRASDHKVSKSGIELANAALQLRVYSILALCVFTARAVVPSLPMRSSELIRRYQLLHDSLAGLTRIQMPASASQLDAAL